MDNTEALFWILSVPDHSKPGSDREGVEVAAVAIPHGLQTNVEIVKTLKVKSFLQQTCPSRMTADPLSIQVS